MVEGGGFEPPKASPTDLQSVPFDRSGTPPREVDNGAGEGTRTPNHLITNEMLYQLSYASGLGATQNTGKIDTGFRTVKDPDGAGPRGSRRSSEIEKAARREAGLNPQSSAAFSREDEG